MAKYLDACALAATILLACACVVDTSAFNNSALWVRFTYLLAYASLIGVQIWVVLIAGLIMYRTLPRHMFSLVQSALFPAFFSVTMTLSFITLAAMLVLHPCQKQTDDIKFQTYVLAFIAGSSTFMRLVLLPINSKLSKKLVALEKEAGVGGEVGPARSEELDMSQEYRAVKKSFGMWHGIIMLLQFAVLILSVYHVYFLAQRSSI